ncbi:hypothetical protein [Paracoccus sp. (in: a-proteobacteria)]|uniref:hypothetical protein n=1 Tax=Paracoccus sp. TaxID=267 RepID=UPI004059E586
MKRTKEILNEVRNAQGTDAEVELIDELQAFFDAVAEDREYTFELSTAAEEVVTAFDQTLLQHQLDTAKTYVKRLVDRKRTALLNKEQSQ